MKNTLSRFLIAALLIALTAAPRRAESKVTVLAALDNSAVATSESQAATRVDDATNVPAVASESRKESVDKPDVRIDHTGVHVGGPHPVDINVPSFKHYGGEREIDVVGIVGIVFGCTVPIAIVAIVFYSRHRRLKMHHETIRAMIEKGMPIPPEMAAGTRGDLLLGNTDVRPGRNDFRGGLILVAIGAALLMIVGKVGWILVFIGAARLVVWLIEDRKT